MLKNLHKIISGDRGRRGFTLMEVVAVVGVVVIMCAIAIPTIVSQDRTTKYKQHNDYAQSIFMAAQANLSQMRSQGRLGQLQKNGENWPSGLHSFLGRSGYAYVTSKESDAYSYQRVLPEGSIDSVVRDQAVIIEFDPATGNVYSVFYSEDKAIFDVYDGYENPNSGLPRNDTEKGKQQMVGYYQGSGVDRHPISEDVPISIGSVSFIRNDGEDGRSRNGNAYLRFKIPNPWTGDFSIFTQGLEVSLDVFGESGGSCVIPVLKLGKNDPEEYVKMENEGNSIRFEVLLDSGMPAEGASAEISKPSFVNHAAGKYDIRADELMRTPSLFADSVKPGDNITVIVRASFTPGDGGKQVDIEPAALERTVNPMFGSLKKTDENGTLGEYKKDTPNLYQVELLGASTVLDDPLYTRHKTNLELVHPNIKACILKIKIDSGVKTWDEINGIVTPTEGGV